MSRGTIHATEWGDAAWSRPRSGRKGCGRSTESVTGECHTARWRGWFSRVVPAYRRARECAPMSRPETDERVLPLHSKGGTDMTTDPTNDPNQPPREPQYPQETPQAPPPPEPPQTPPRYGEGPYVPQEPATPSSNGPYGTPPPSGVYGAPPQTGPYGEPPAYGTPPPGNVPPYGAPPPG